MGAYAALKKKSTDLGPHTAVANRRGVIPPGETNILLPMPLHKGVTTTPNILNFLLCSNFLTNWHVGKGGFLFYFIFYKKKKNLRLRDGGAYSEGSSPRDARNSRIHLTSTPSPRSSSNISACQPRLEEYCLIIPDDPRSALFPDAVSKF